MDASVLCKTKNMPKAHKMAAGGLGSTVSPLRVAKPPKSFDFFSFKAR